MSPAKVRYEDESRVLVLYTSGAIGMKINENGDYYHEANGLTMALRDFPPLNDTEYLQRHHHPDSYFHDPKLFCLPTVRGMQKRTIYWVEEYDPPMNSSNMRFDDWIRIAKDIHKVYDEYDGFVILHGNDTLSYTACALSFVFENLGKPVVLTGSGITLSEVRSDARENLIGALIVAGNLNIPEVTVYFNNKLLRGNRVTHLDNSSLQAIDSPNMAPIADMKIDIEVNTLSIMQTSSPTDSLIVHTVLCDKVGVLRIFPSIAIECVRATLESMKGCVLQTFGAGNMPSERTDIFNEIKLAIERGCIIVNCSQCIRGQVDADYYTSKALYNMGVIAGSDMTIEAALTKLAYVLGKDEWNIRTKKQMMKRNLRGELTVAHAISLLHESDMAQKVAKFLGLFNTNTITIDGTKSDHQHRSSLSTGTYENRMQVYINAIFPSLLFDAAAKGNVPLIEILRLNGANLIECDHNRMTAMHIGANAGHVNVLRYFLKHGASIDARDYLNQSPIIGAIKNCHFDCIKFLLNAGATVDISDTIAIGNELCLAADSNKLDLLKAWRSAGVNLNLSDYDGRTALHIAASKGYDQLVVFLLENGANRNQCDNFGALPIVGAERNRHEKVVKILHSQ